MIAWVESISENTDATFVKIRWSSENIGFGEIDIITDYMGETTIKTEAMGRDFVRDVFNALVDSATLIN